KLQPLAHVVGWLHRGLEFDVSAHRGLVDPDLFVKRAKPTELAVPRRGRGHVGAGTAPADDDMIGLQLVQRLAHCHPAHAVAGRQGRLALQPVIRLQGTTLDLRQQVTVDDLVHRRARQRLPLRQIAPLSRSRSISVSSSPNISLYTWSLSSPTSGGGFLMLP